LEEVEFDQLKSIFFEMLKRSAHFPEAVIQEEEWQVSHKLAWLKELLNLEKKLGLEELFLKANSRMELIVVFLALLEMMKLGQACVVREKEIYFIIYVS
jgi:segregation and condensation protein A